MTPPERRADVPTGRGMPRWLTVVVLLAAVRTVLLGLVHRAPAQLAEANDLGRLAYNHALIRGLLFDWGPIAGVPEAEHYPPLYYVGVPAALSWTRELTLPVLLGLNGLCLFGAAWAIWRTARLLGSPTAGAWAVGIFVCLPGVAGQVTIAGAEPLLLLAFAFYLAGLVDLVERWAIRSSLLAGAALAVGLLVKWSLVLSACVPGAVAAALALRGGALGVGDGQPTRGRRAALIIVIPGTSLLVLLPWLLFGAELDLLLLSASMEPTGTGLASFALPFRWLAALGLGPFGVALAVIAGGVAVSRGPRPVRPAFVLLAASAVAVPLAHALIPHKELRYLLPAYVPIALLIGWALDSESRWARMPAYAVMFGLAASTYVAPWLLAGPEYRPDAQLRLAPARDDLGLRAAVCHPGLAGPDGSRVLFVPGGPTPYVYRSLLDWELARCPWGEAVVHDFATVLDPGAAPQLESSTHVLLTRPPLAFEEAILEAHGYVSLATVSTRLDRLPVVHLWRRAVEEVPTQERLTAIMTTVPGGPPVHGMVVDALSGAPLTAQVKIPRPEPLSTAVTDDSGRFVLQAPVSLGGLTVVRAEARDRVPAQWLLTPHDARAVRLELWPRDELESFHRRAFGAGWNPALATVVVDLAGELGGPVWVGLGQSFEAVYFEGQPGSYSPGAEMVLPPGAAARVWFLGVIPSSATSVEVGTEPGVICEGPPIADIAADTLVTARFLCSSSDP